MLIYQCIIIFSGFAWLDGSVCGTVDVRNYPENIRHYQNCTVINGSLSVLLMDIVEDEVEYLNNNFTELREITDYLLVYKLSKLTSLDLLFPKLTTIKAKTKYLNGYSLVVYDMPDLTEIGLKNLRTIEKGKVKIGGENPNLCYVETVNWHQIGASCLLNDKANKCENKTCPFFCGGLCWNQLYCQKMDKDSCHDLCIGCTKSNSTLHCIKCKYYEEDGECVQSCGNDKIADDNLGKCVTPSKCVSKTDGNNGTWSIFKNFCLARCPLWFKRNTTGWCIPSNTNVCKGTLLKTTFDLKNLQDCTYINGSLEIQLSENPSQETLYRSFANITTITGYLKISRTLALISLNVFEHLTEIHGKELWSRHFSLIIFENGNLEELFLNNTKIKIQDGEVLIQNNPVLCDSKIIFLSKNTTKVSNGLDAGEQCGYPETDLRPYITGLSETHADICWTKPNNNLSVTFFYSWGKGFAKRVCYDTDFDDVWFSFTLVENFVNLTNLESYSYYQFYITSYGGVRSPFYHFITLGEPALPDWVVAESVKDTAINLSWPFPSNRELLSYYQLSVYHQPDSEEMLLQRDYCNHPMKPAKKWIFPETCGSHSEMLCRKMEFRPEDFANRNKRSMIQSVANLIKEVNITANLTDFLIEGLKPYQMYIFYLKSCGKLTCSGSMFGVQRTQKRVNADMVEDVVVTVESSKVLVTWKYPKAPNSVVLSFKIEYHTETFSRTECITSRFFNENLGIYEIDGFAEGSYKIRVKALTLAGSGEPSDWTSFVVSAFNWFFWLAGLMSVVFVLVIGFIIWRVFTQRGVQDDQARLVDNMYSENMFNDDFCTLDDETLRIVRELGENFRIAYRN